MREYRSLIVNADDFGLNKEVNNGIIQAFKAGIVTSTSLLVNREGFEDSLAKIKENPGLDIGLHLNIFRGKPISELDYLVNKKGEFSGSSFKFFLKLKMNKELAKKEILQEFEAQIKKAKEAGVKFSHLDTEKHLHVFPEIFEAVCQLAKKYKVPSVRFPFETNSPEIKVKLSQSLKKAFSKRFFNKDYLILDSSELLYPDYFYGISLSKNFSQENLGLFLKNLKPGVTELSCHPGMNSKVDSYIDNFRKQELEVLTNPETRKIINNNKIKLITFKDVK